MTPRRLRLAEVDAAVAPGDAPVAFGGDIEPGTLLTAYRHGLFPVPADAHTSLVTEALFEDQVAAGEIALIGPAGAAPYALAWWSPDPRPVIPAGDVRLGRRLRARIRGSSPWTTTADRDFARVVGACAQGREPVWLTGQLQQSLGELHRQGHAHSLEVWEDGELVGGAFGIAVGPVLSLDSMFHHRSGASRVAIADLGRRFADAGGTLLDTQWPAPHLDRLGAGPLPRADYLSLLRTDRPVGPLPTVELPARRLAQDD